jgi:hypothetical protein
MRPMIQKNCPASFKLASHPTAEPPCLASDPGESEITPGISPLLSFSLSLRFSNGRKDSFGAYDRVFVRKARINYIMVWLKRRTLTNRESTPSVPREVTGRDRDGGGGLHSPILPPPAPPPLRATRHAVGPLFVK